MALVLNDDQEMLRDAAHGFIQKNASVAELRRVRDERSEDGFSRDLWRAMAEQGFAGVLIDEDHGGSEFGHVAAGVIASELGKTLAPSPFISTAVMAATAISRGGSEEQKSEHLPAIAGGERVFSLAVEEGAKHNPQRIATRAERSGNGFKLTGEKRFVADGGAADYHIIAARTAGAEDEAEGVTLFLVPANAPGLSARAAPYVDSRNYAELSLEGVEVDGGAVLGELDKGGGLLSGVLNAGRGALSAEMHGLSQASFDMTIDYLKTRTQFGTEIGRFQALQHRAAHLWTELELAESAVLKGQQALDENFDGAGPFIALAKAKSGAVARLATQEAIQMHGGIGMTDEHDIGFYLKRARAADELFGDADYHAGQIATLRGY